MIENGAEVFAFSMVSGSKLGVNAHAGPFARLRMGAELGDEAHVGNFVELKNTRMGAKSKSMHLAYLGDSQLGSAVNIGAGTITCNYACLYGMSPYHFCRKFKRSTGSSPKQFVAMLRIDQSKDLLKRTDLPIKEISAICGFQNRSHFGRVFRGLVGLSPARYRRTSASPHGTM